MELRYKRSTTSRYWINSKITSYKFYTYSLSCGEYEFYWWFTFKLIKRELGGIKII